MKKTDLAYAAGFFDGEGTLSIVKTRQYGYIQYQLRVSACSTDEWACRRFQFMFGGRIRKRPGRNPHHKTCWDWRISCREAGDFLKIVLPYLHIKRDRAEIALKFQQAKHFTGRNRPRTDEETVLEEAQHILIAKANERGVRQL